MDSSKVLRVLMDKDLKVLMDKDLKVLMDKDLKVLMDKDLKVLELPTASNKDLTASTDSTKDLHSPPTTRTRLVWSTSACSTS
jgi:hypothetical protein